MNISYNWLKDYVDFDLTPDELAAALTSIGLETGSVEEIQPIKGGLEGLVVGEVLTCVEHPNSDHLHITTVDVANDTPLQIVCGAKNVAAGQKVIVATIGTKLYNGEECFTIKKSKMRGVDSFGMICAEDEIGVGTSHDGIIVLPKETKSGTPAKEYYNIKSDYLLEVDITPNRADACSHYGVARDLYAYLLRNGYKTTLKKPFDEASFSIDNENLNIDITVENVEACPRYAGITVSGVQVKESPKWLKERLEAIGVRPINNIVDITNYIVNATGQPLHCFDANEVGKRVIIKTMPAGTKFKTLDGIERELNEKDLMICNERVPMCMAGVFGGEDSGVKDSTTSVFIESAYFHPTWIRKAARRHGLNTDASFRYERGIDPLAVVYNLKYAASLIREVAGGEISSQIKEVYPTPFEKFKVVLPYDYANKLIGKVISPCDIKSIVRSLEMDIVAEDEKSLTLLVPPYRVDVKRPCDVVEDILRIYGYNNIEIPSSLNSCITVKGLEDKSNKLQNIVAEQLVGCGFNEIMNNSLSAAAYYDGVAAYNPQNLVRLMNPLSSDLNIMRQTLLFGGLESISHNINHKNSDIRFFEFGNCYRFDEQKRTTDKILSPYSETYHMALWVSGKRVANNWAHPDEDSSFYELKAYLENVLRRLGIDCGKLLIEHSDEDIFAAGIRYVNASKKVLAKAGIVSKHILKRFEIFAPVYFADIDWNTVMKTAETNTVLYKEISKYPTVRRDLALLLDSNVQFEDIRKTAFETERKLLKEVSLFDVYEGKNIENGKKSYAISFTLQAENDTLNDKQIDKVMSKLINTLQIKFNATLR